MITEKGLVKFDTVENLSFADPDGWLTLTPTESIRAAVLILGDRDVGPSISLGRITQVEGEELDWKYTIDPVHFHGTDQFRLLVGGDWVVAGRPVREATFSFQEAGKPYQEHPGPTDHSWMLLAYGDKRGEPATLINVEKREQLKGEADIMSAPLAGSGDYPHPAGPKGIPAIVTSGGAPKHGYFGSGFDEGDGWTDSPLGGRVFAGAWGDAEGGPVVLLTKAQPGAVVQPACTFSSDLLVAVAAGSIEIDGEALVPGQLRALRGGVPTPALRAGADGASVAVLVADRRSALAVEGDQAQDWSGFVRRQIDGLLAGLPG